MLTAVAVSDQDHPSLTEARSVIADVLAGADVLPLPLAVKRSLWKSIARLIGGATDLVSASLEYPTAWVEAKTDQIRATADARRIVKLEVAKQVPGMIASDDALAYRAVAYLGNEMLVEQSNREATLRYAIGDLRSTPPEGDAETEIDDDWLHAFIKEASTKSSSEMQFLFGRILSGEIRNPGTFSIRSVRILSMMSQTTARQFEKLCNVSISLRNDVTMVVSYSGHAGDNALAKHGLSFLVLSNLAENNLISNDFHTKIDLTFVGGNSSHFDYAGNIVWLSKNNTSEGKRFPKIRGPLFSKIGNELRKIVSMKPDQMYTAGFIEYFQGSGCVFIKATGRREDGVLVGKPWGG